VTAHELQAGVEAEGYASRDGISGDRWRSHLERHIPIAHAGVDPEGVHQMRVAIARLRVWLALGGWRVLDDDLRWVRDRMAPVRDLDVQLTHDPPPDWAATLRRRRALVERELRSMLDGERLPSLLLALSYLPPVPPDKARSMLPRMARRALRRARTAERHASDLKALHRLRCAVRRLRFALEWLDVDTADLVKAQDALGDACDLSVALDSLGRHRDKHAGGYRETLTRALRRAERRAHAAFRHVRPHLEELASCSCS
jgi:CHAD domain-containing protein